MIVYIIGGPRAGKIIEIEDGVEHFELPAQPVRSVFTVGPKDRGTGPPAPLGFTYHLHRVKIGKDKTVSFATSDSNDFGAAFSELWVGYSKFMENPK